MRSKREEVDQLSMGKKTISMFIKGIFGTKKEVPVLMAEIEEVIKQILLIDSRYSANIKFRTILL